MGLDLTGLGSVFDFGKSIIERLIPDPALKLKATQELAQMQLNGELAKTAQENGLMLAQIDVNKTEAQNPKLFVSGWRPAVGWVCVLGLGYQFVAWPLVSWASSIWHYPPPPQLDMGTLITLLAGLLGFGGMRTFEKLNGVAAK